MAVAQESEFLAVNQKIRVRVPAATPFHQHTNTCARCQSRRGGGLQTRSYPVQDRARAPFPGPSFKSRTTQWHCVDRGASPRGSSFHFPRARGRQQSAPLGTARYLGPTLSIPFHPRARGRQQSARFGSARYPGQHRGARPFQIPPKRWERRTPLVSARDWCNSSWRISIAL